ncbi:MAG TPA: sensor domain-containing protein, partial [Rhizomicrobium sp.]|nr:sensor domain-containing protein [Rhizomicrobium sp.]
MNSDRPPETVRAYLADLRRALKGAPAGLISDALADTEDHLNNEISHNPEIPESQILATVIETYGTPQEIAEEYRDMEATIGGPFPKSDAAPERRYGFFNVISDPRTYGALLYMLLSLITGIFYFTWTVTGLSLTVGFAILIIGIPFALLFMGSVRVLSHVEGRIVEGLLGVRMPRRLPPTTQADETLWARIKDAFTDSRTWSSMFYMLLMLPLGIAYFTIAITGLAVSLGVTGGSLYALITNDASHIQIDDVPWLQHLLHTAPGLILFAFLGVILFFFML